MYLKFIDGGVCAPAGFLASGIHCGIRKNKEKKDLALIFSQQRATAAAVYTQNLVKGAPITVTKRNISDGYAQAVICNSGNANTCNSDGEEKARIMCELTAHQLGINADDVIVASTGVIGQTLPIEPITSSVGALKAAASNHGNDAAAEAIMTTDTYSKQVAVEFKIGDKICRIGGMAKGSGMIHPDMATMLCFITSDAVIEKSALKAVLKEVVDDTFNMISVDGDTSTNDMVAVLCNSMAQNEEITLDSQGYYAFKEALFAVLEKLSRLMAGDGEGATRLIECRVECAACVQTAKKVAKSIICSSLLKAAVFGADANWGRVLCAIGYSKCDIDINKIDVSFESEAGTVEVCRGGFGVDFSEEKAKSVLLCDEIIINVNLNDGDCRAVAWGCDLTYDYVKINGDYRT